MTLQYTKIPQSRSQREAELLEKIQGNKILNIIGISFVFAVAVALICLPYMSSLIQNYTDLEQISTQTHVPGLVLLFIGIFGIWYQRKYQTIMAETLKNPMTREVFITIYEKKLSDRNHTKYLYANVADSKGQSGKSYQLYSCSKDTKQRYAEGEAATAYYHPASKTLIFLDTANEMLRLHTPDILWLAFKR